MRSLRLIGGLTLALGLAMPALGATTTGGTTFTVTITNVSRNDTLRVGGTSGAVKAPIAPGVFVVDPLVAAFEQGRAATPELQALAEDGNYEPLQKVLQAKFGERAGMFVPGLAFTITANPGDRLSFATMFVQSNDKFYAPANGAIDLFDADGDPISGDRTESARLFDAGTEVDQQPGAGADQAPRQKGPNQGDDQNGVVAEARDGFTYPAVSDVIRIDIQPAE